MQAILGRKVGASIGSLIHRSSVAGLNSNAFSSSSASGAAPQVWVERLMEPNPILSATDVIELRDDIFSLPVRTDILHRNVVYQLAKRRQGTRKTKDRAEVSGTGKKPHPQKGTGRARQGTLRAPHMRGGGVTFGPVVRSHAQSLPKKVRTLGLKTALSAKYAEGALAVVEDAHLSSTKTRDLDTAVAGRGWGRSVLIVDQPADNTSSSATLDSNLMLATRNMPNVDVLPTGGLNVYDILRKDTVVITRAALDALYERLDRAKQ